MFLYDHFSVDEKGHLKIEGVDTVELAKKYGTPLYVMSANYIRNACEKYHEVMKSFSAKITAWHTPARLFRQSLYTG